MILGGWIDNLPSVVFASALSITRCSILKSI
jgi:hypothetical protein